MKLLVIMSNYPFPPRQGSAIVAYHTVRELAKRHSIDFICCDAAPDKGDFERCVDKLEIVLPEKTPRLLMLLRYALYFIMGVPAAVAAHRSPKMNERVVSMLVKAEYDAILTYELSALQYCPKEMLQKVVANIEDPESIKLDRMRLLAVWPLWHRIRLTLLSMTNRRYEKNLLPTIGKVTLLSESDVLDMRKVHGLDNLGCVPYGVDRKTEREIPGFDEREEGMVVFSGSMFHQPNVDGALYFLENIFPIVQEKHPSATLWIVGSRPDSRIVHAALRFRERVVVTGAVGSMSEYLMRARVSICPVRLRIGVQTKILEAMSCGTPVVTLSAGNSGIGGVTGEELWVEDDSTKFAERVVALLRKEQWHQLSSGGRRLIEKRFSWEHSAEVLEREIAVLQTIA